MLSEERANRLIKVLRRLLSFAIELEIITQNPASGLRLRHSIGRDQVWTREEVDTVVAKAMEMGLPGWAIGVRLGYDTAQRLSDVLNARWQEFDGEGIEFIQSKTKAKVWTPLTPETIALLSAVSRQSVSHIVAGNSGKPITRNHFHRVFRKVRDQAGIRDELQFLDLRGTAATEVMAGGGRAEPLTGHRPGS